MPNLCFYEMRIKGTNDDVMEFHKRMTDYNIPNHLYRIFEADINENTLNDNITVIDVSGSCAWSLESCCRASGYSEGIDLFEVNSKELNLEIECWSSEDALGFQEHYLYKNGECYIEECVDWEDYYYDDSFYDSFDEFKAECELPNYVTEEDFDDYHYYIGGFDNYGEYSI